MEKISGIHIERLPEGFYLPPSEEMPGLVQQGRDGDGIPGNYWRRRSQTTVGPSRKNR